MNELQIGIESILLGEPVKNVVLSLIGIEGCVIHESDEHLRDLERKAAQGDNDAADALAKYRVRIGQLPFLAIMEPIEHYGRNVGWRRIIFGSEGNYGMSIQAGASSTGRRYSTPDTPGLLATEYTAWEVALYKGHRQVAPLGKDSKEFHNLPHKERWRSDHTVAPYMPVKHVQDVFNWMVKHYGRPHLL